jgi:hypothetical protein
VIRTTQSAANPTRAVRLARNPLARAGAFDHNPAPFARPRVRAR